MYASFPFSFEGGVWCLIVLIPDHCSSSFFFFNFLKFIYVTSSVVLMHLQKGK